VTWDYGAVHRRATIERVAHHHLELLGRLVGSRDEVPDPATGVGP
jgi:hypothetical protein